MSRIANRLGRATLVTDGGGLDVERASEGRFAADPQAIYDRFDEFASWAQSVSAEDAGEVGTVDLLDSELGSPVPFPRQVFAIGLNYEDHIEETGAEMPERLAVFTKYPTCVTGGFGEVALPEGGKVDWEVELVVVMGRYAHRIADWEAWSHVAGVSVGLDISERVLQRAAGGQFAMGKSYPGFGPIGPYLVTTDELTSPDDLAISCSVSGELMQSSRTSKMVYSVPRIVEELARVVPLLPGDVIFTGTPAGVGWPRGRYLEPGDDVEATIEEIGTIRTRMIAS